MIESHFHYSVYGQNVCSDFALMELPVARFERRDLGIRAGNQRSMALQDSTAPLRWRTNIGPDAVVRRDGSQMLLTFDGWCEFLIASDHRDLLYRVWPGVDTTWFRTTLYSLVIPLIMQRNGMLNLHAGGVLVGSTALAFMAESGTGKSTIVGAYARAGYPFLTDDVLALRELGAHYMALPAYPWIGLSVKSQRALWNHSIDGDLDEELKAKIAIRGALGTFVDRPVPLGALYLTNRSDCSTISIEPVHRAQALGQVLEQANGLILMNDEERRALVGRVARLVSSVPIWRLTVPSDYARLPEVIAAVVEHTRSLPSIDGLASRSLSAD